MNSEHRAYCLDMARREMEFADGLMRDYRRIVSFYARRFP